jgi:hypothetical protein
MQSAQINGWPVAVSNNIGVRKVRSALAPIAAMMRDMTEENRLRPQYIPPRFPPEHPGALSLEPTTRSNVPRVLGILATVFAPLGLLVTMGLAFGFDDELSRYGLVRSQLGAFGTWLNIGAILGVALFAVHLAAGIQAIRYARSAPMLLTIYSIFALLLLVMDVAISIATLPSNLPAAAFDDLVGPRIGLAIMSAPWPIVALVLISMRGARRACGRA